MQTVLRTTKRLVLRKFERAVMRRIGMRYRYTYRELVQPKNQLVTFRPYQLNLDGREERVYQKYWNASAVHFVEAGL